MKEIDTETSVVWPTWCYSDEVNCNVLKKCSKIEKDFDVNTDRESNNNIISIRKIQSRTNCNKKPAPLSTLDQLSLPTTSIVGENKMLSERSLLLSGYINSNTINSAKRNCDISNTSLAEVPLSGQGTGVTITPTTTAAAAAAYLYLEKVKNEQMSPRVTAAQLDSFKDAIMESSAAVAVAAAMVNNNNSISINNNSNNNNNNNNKTNHNNSNNNSSGSASNCSNNISSINNLVNSQVQNQIINNSINNTSTSDELHSHSLTQSCNQTLQQEQQQQQQHQLQKQTHHHNHQQQQQHLSLHMNSNHVKKERLSPSTNGDLQTSLSRSRSTTPSSFRGTSPQNSVHSSPSDTLGPMHNLSTNLLNSIHQAAASNRHSNLGVSSSSVNSASSGLPTDFSTRNYSDFMRSLAAKYNNTNPNDNFKRNTLFEATSNNATAQKKITTAAQKTSYVTSPSTSLNKEITITTTSSLPPPIPLTTVPISPGESAIKLSQQNKLAAAVAACSNNVSPYMTSFLSSLPFSPGIFPHLIDMSSTQALITLARAAKENEIHNILSAPSQNQKRSAAGASPSPSPSLNMALQQAAQFISPALIYSAQLQKQQLQQQQNHQQQSQVSRQSSPRLTNISNSATPSTTSAKSTRNLGEKVNVSPLDLSSQPPPAKRFKAESTSSQSSTDCVMHTTITRRASSSTATTSPSPPPLTEKSLNASAIAVPTATVTDSVVVGSSSKTEATTTAFTPIKVASPTSATSSIASAVTVRQCQAQSEELNSWTVDDVCAFVGSIDICAVYVKHFRDQCIDGSGLPLLTEDHLVNSLGMKLGPALKLRSVLAKKLGGPCPCVSCVAQVQQVLALQNSGLTAAAITTTSTNATNISTIGSYTKSSGSCNSHFAQHSSATCNSSSSMSCSSYNSGINISSVNKNESTTATTTTAASSTRSLTTNVCNSDGSTSNTPRSNSSPNTNVDHFSSPPPLPPPAPSTTILQQQQQQHLHQKQQQHQQPSLATSDNADSSS